ncbi:hypothetical protein HZI73_24240 [Vallitalea pronyensis]|uniref:DUF5666 domain-containing protein n=1 Tax=Vallitalea pronyensis TaxID=1348613 RepID=A0A8J8MP91_9FIRM|nr:hypothetical protein [Vallitalea pronyensis]QUI25216.1 hypothetical protein HZI73_24240 [Vallitalea pronyensis]
MKKIITIALILFVASQILTGCTHDKDKANEGNTSTPDSVDNHGENDASTDLKKYDIVGTIHAIREGTVSILSGDTMKDYTHVEGIEKCYVGETVGIIKKDKDYTVEKIKMDFTVRHTTMGDTIKRVEGTIKEMTDQQVVIASTDGDITLTISEPLTSKVGDRLMVDYIVNGDNILYHVYLKDSAMTLNVDKIDRIDATGEMMLMTKDKDGMEYHVIILSSTVVDFNLSELEAGDVIDVYAEVIREKYPAEVDAKMVMRVEKEE